MTDQRELLELEIEGIINESGENIIVTDSEGFILRAVKNSEEMYGISSEELVGTSVRELEQKKIFNPSVTLRVIQQKKPVTFMQKTGTGKIIMTRGVPIFNEENEIKRIISFSHDMTEIEELKSEYEKLQLKMMRYENEIEQLRGREIVPSDVVINSKSMQTVWGLVHKVAKSDATVVLQGESGVGKTVFAKALHNGSDRKDKPMIEVNCGAIPESLFESEMFGYEAGAFTGAASKGKMGLIELADQGTLFLDEVGELPFSIQVKLLKVLQEKKVTRMGSTKSRTVNFRLVAATNRDLQAMVKAGTFRDDLFYRLNVVPISIPPLRDRKEEIHQLTETFLDKFNEKYDTDKTMHPSALKAFWQHDWPGNVRELENLMERLVVTLENKTILPDHLPFTQKVEEDGVPEYDAQSSSLQEALEHVERNWLLRACRDCKSTYEMADYLGLSQPTVVRRLKKYNIDSKTNH
ncbi:sigma 54-interacting transcriptional regulator [Fictibacillus sp. WQ 8-8]|uniref:sigma-54 interaction domain-containing protein n=1 Tax=Fictibacillus sp. WQ 8-8 TaxID=2938788 RepID=UPI00210C7E75|nr:sigma 54-interacting transcriptional regulator [Fictibacillus sp. WQ 8-8]MCQ6264622.1 sigma 54-interacting transcriptional regulator [Fictibacillus sp. WQ 8-8]